MRFRNSPTGVPYLASDDADEPSGSRARPLRSVALFLALFIAMQTLWNATGDTAIERLVVDRATVEVAAVWVRLLTPEVQVVAAGPRLTAPGGGINVLKGCEGTEVLFLLVAAFAVAGGSWRRSVAGTVLGAVVVYLLNQVRILALFYAYRHDHALFNQLHGTVAPLIMVLMVGFYYFAWLQWAPTKHDDRQTA